MKNTIVLNIWSGPGVGKSTESARLFTLLKEHDNGGSSFEVDMAREYFKDLAWMGIKGNPALQREAYFEQMRREAVLIGNVDYVITDSPTAYAGFYSEFYNTPSWVDEFEQVKRSKVVHIDFLAPRLKPYNPNGRNETREQAEAVDKAMPVWFEKFTGRKLIPLTSKRFGIEIFEHVLDMRGESPKLD